MTPAERSAMRDAARYGMRAALIGGPYADAAEALARALWALADADPGRARTWARAAAAAAAASFLAEVGRDPDPDTWHLDVLAEAAEVIG